MAAGRCGTRPATHSHKFEPPQSRKLIAMLGLVVDGLDRCRPEAVASATAGCCRARSSARRLRAGQLRTALLWSPERGLGPTASDEVIGAWAAAYRTLTAAMQTPGGLDSER